MKNLTLQKKKIFISYCHGDIEEEWVVKFVQALATKGIECIVDIYDLKLVNDLTYFMETIKAEDIDKVVMLLGKNIRKRLIAKRVALELKRKLYQVKFMLM